MMFLPIEQTAKVFMGAGKSALSIFKSGSLFVKTAIYPKMSSTFKIGGKVALHSKISDFSFQNRNFIVKMATILS